MGSRPGLARRRLTRPVVAAAACLALAAPAGTAQAAPPPPTHAAASEHHELLRTWLEDTWRSFVAMTNEQTGLPADNIGGNLDPASRSGYTSPTNIGAYLWSTVVARDTGLISRQEAYERLRQTIGTVSRLERHEPSGQFYNWYDEATGEKLSAFPTGEPIKPFLSSVDNGWLATGLRLAGNAEPRVREAAEAIYDQMDFGFYYDPHALGPDAPAGQLRGGFWDEDPHDPSAVKGNYTGEGPDVWFTGHHYGAFNTEPRIASYLGIAEGDIPPEHYYATYRTFPDTCDWSWSETQGLGEWRTYSGVDVFEGAYPYRGMRIVPTWGGSMFEALMVPLFVPEETWGPKSWGVNHPLYVKGQIEHGLEEAGYGYWGFSPSNNPAGGYREYGVDQLGMEPNGYSSDQERTVVDQPYGDCPGREGSEPPEQYGDGVVTPHASFLALRYAPGEAVANLENLRRDFDAYGPGGFYDAIAVRSGQVSKRYLSLDQGMVMAALGNALTNDAVRRYVSRGNLAQRVRPLMRVEEFGAADRPAATMED